MRKAMVSWLLCTVIGATIVAVPDDGPRLLSFSAAHGPSTLDALGIGILLIGWAAFVAAFWRRRERFASRMSTRWMCAGSLTCGLGAGLILASVASDFPHWWVAGAGVLLLAQLLAAYAVTRSA